VGSYIGEFRDDLNNCKRYIEYPTSIKSSNLHPNN